MNQKKKSWKAWRKKHMNLPTRPCFDPFIKTLVYTNRNGRTVILKNGRWQALREGR